MVLCAAEMQDDGSEKVEFVEPPEGGKQRGYIVFSVLRAFHLY